MSLIIGIIMILAVILTIVLSVLHSIKLEKIAQAAKPADDRIYKVFAVDIDGNTYYVIKKYVYDRMSRTYSWNLQCDFSYFKNMTLEEVIDLCDKMNTFHLENLNNTKINNILNNTIGQMID